MSVSFKWPSAGIYGLSNSLLDTPWRKVLQGKSHFTSVVSDQSLSRDGLMQELLNVLCNEELWVLNTHWDSFFINLSLASQRSVLWVCFTETRLIQFWRARITVTASPRSRLSPQCLFATLIMAQGQCVPLPLNLSALPPGCLYPRSLTVCEHPQCNNQPVCAGMPLWTKGIQRLWPIGQRSPAFPLLMWNVFVCLLVSRLI